MNDSKDDKDGMTGTDLQQSQSGGGSGEFGGNQFQRQGGGGVSGGDVGTGGSSGSGGYGDMQNQQNQQGQGEGQSGLAGGDLRQGGGSSEGQSRGERYDEAQGGGRGPGSVSSAQGEDGISSFAKEGGNGAPGTEGDGAPAADSAFERDQQAHQDRGQSAIERD